MLALPCQGPHPHCHRGWGSLGALGASIGTRGLQEGHQPGLGSAGMGRSAERRVWTSLPHRVSPPHPGAPPASHIAETWQALPDSPIYTEETSGLPYSFFLLKHPHRPAPRSASILVTAHSLPHLVLLMPVRSGLSTKEEPGTQRGEMTHVTTSHSKEMAGPRFEPSLKSLQGTECPLPSLLSASYSFWIPFFPKLPPPSAKSILPHS